MKSFKSEQKRKLAARQKEMDEINKMLKDAEAVITEKPLVGADISTVRKHKDVLQVRRYRSTNLSVGDEFSIYIWSVDFIE